jgi:hypothetical protein
MVTIMFVTPHHCLFSPVLILCGIEQLSKTSWLKTTQINYVTMSVAQALVLLDLAQLHSGGGQC